MRTIRRPAVSLPVRERRAWVRQRADFNVEISNALVGHRVRARAINASAGGLAVLVEPDEWEDSRQDRRVQLHVPGHASLVEARSSLAWCAAPSWLHVPGHASLAEAELVDSTRVVVNGRPQRLVRLRLSDDGHNGHVSPDGTAKLSAEDRGWPFSGTLDPPSNGHAPVNVDGTIAMRNL